MSPNPLPKPGEVVSGKYRIDSVIGQGGMGVVLGATDLSLGRPVAIKFLTPARAENPEAAARFAREARAAASIQSEHVVRVFEVGTAPNGAPYIVMEHLRGSDLAGVIEQRGPMPIDYACDLVLQTCEALGDAHARGIVHRDLKPQNLFLTQRPDGAPAIKVLDFGISKAADNEDAVKLTATDMVMGTPLYMSPEQVRSVKNVDARADIWALGVILHELLTASPPFDGPTASALHAAIAMDAPPPLRQKRPDAPAVLEAIVLRCLEKNPAQRFQSVAELADALRPFATQVGQTAAARVIRTVPSSNPIILSSAPPAMSAPTMANASTMNAWHQSTASSPQHPPVPVKSSSIGLIVGIVLGALVLLGGAIGIVALFFMRSTVRIDEQTQAAPSPSALPAPVTTVPTIVADTATTPVATTPAAPVVPKPHPIAAHDAGPAPAPTQTPQQAEDERERNNASALQPGCDLELRKMQLAAVGQERTAVSQQMKTPNCNLGAGAVKCQRQVCRTACGNTGDQACLVRMDNDDRAFPAKY